jgi:hypothetical protein
MQLNTYKNTNDIFYNFPLDLAAAETTMVALTAPAIG